MNEYDYNDSDSSEDSYPDVTIYSDDSDPEGENLPFTVTIHDIAQFTGLSTDVLYLIREMDASVYFYFEHLFRIECRKAILRMTPT